MIPPTPEHDRIRVSDAERRQAVAALEENYAAGRLDLDEFEQRVSAGYAAHTRGELAELTTDLPSAEQSHDVACRFNPCLFWALMISCPPAGLIYWIVTCRACAGTHVGPGPWAPS